MHWIVSCSRQKKIYLTALFLWALTVPVLLGPTAAARNADSLSPVKAEFNIGVIGMAGGAVEAMSEAQDRLNVNIKKVEPGTFATDPLPELAGFDLIFVSFAAGDYKDNYKRAVVAAKKKNSGLRIFCVGPPHLYQNWAEWIGPENVILDKKMAAYYGLSRQSMGDMVQFALVNYFGRTATVPKPGQGELVRIYHPEYGQLASVKQFFDQAAQAGWDIDTTPRVVIGSWRHHVLFHQPQVIRALMDELKTQGILSVCLVADDPKFRQHLIEFKPDLVIMTSHTRESVDFWKTLNVPRIHALWFTEESIAQWETNNRPGMSVGRQVHQITSAELKGATECLTSGGTTSGHDSGEQIVPIPDRIQRICGRAKNWIALKKTPNAQKKIALVTYDRVADKLSLMSGPHHCLNAPKSMMGLLERLKAEGYTTANLPADETELLDRLIDHGRQMGTWEPASLDALAKSGKAVLIPMETYQKWFETKVPEWRRQEVVKHWGPPPGNLMMWAYSGQKYLVIPRLDLGNLVLLTQPPKGEALTATTKKEMDETILPPTHHYLATYFWLQEEFKADAVVHFGSHGTEWLFEGKQAFMSKSDWSDIMLANMPNINPWLSSNIAEHTPCKRRAYAVTPDFMPPPLMDADLPENLLNMESTITKYLALDEGALKAKFADTITAQVKSSNLDVEWIMSSGEKDLSVRLEKLRSMAGFTLNEAQIKRISVYLHDLKNQKIPSAMHTLGKGPDDKLLIPYIIQCAGKRFTSALAGLALDNSSAAGNGEASEDPMHGKALEVLDLILHSGFSNIEAVKGAGLTVTGKKLPEALHEGLELARRLYKEMSDPTMEMDSIINALDGQFIVPGSSGSPERNPGAIPTGRNMVVLNPAELPTRASWELGTQLMKTYLANELKAKGRYPEKIAFSLVPYATYSDYGITECQILYLMGVRPVWDTKNRVRDVALIPAKELGRPRIDVFLSARSVYREELPSLMKFMDKAIRLAASHKEKDNYVYRNSQAIQSALTASGRSEKTARALSLARMFGTEKDEIQDSHNWFFYLADRTGEWDSRKDLLDVYLKYCKHVYTKDHWGESAPQAFDQAIQGTESIIRSWYDNRDFALGNKFSWWVEGMMSLAIKESTSKEPDYLYMDVRNPDNARVVRAEDAVKMDLNSRLLNPKWLKALMKEGYAGATVLAKDTGNLMGWEITRENTITDRDWQRVTDVYVKDTFDLGLVQWFEQNNPHAFQDITVTLLETVRKGYWQADEKTLEQIVQAYAQSVVDHGTGSGIRAGGNEKLEQFVTRQLTAPGKPELNALAESFKKKAAQMILPPEQTQGKQQVQGKKMVHEQMEQPDKTKEKNNTSRDHMMLYFIALGILAIILAGFVVKGAKKK